MLALLSCHKEKWSTLHLGPFLLDVPPDFHFTPIKGIDSQGGIIGNDSLKLNTDFGWYTDTVVQTPQEYLSHRYYLRDAGIQFMKNGVTYVNDNPKVDQLSIRPATAADSSKKGFSGCDYVATCKYQTKVFDWPVRLPETIKHYTVKVDSVNGNYRRLILPKKDYPGKTAIYLRYNKMTRDAYNHYAIVIGKDSLTSREQALALAIFATLRVDTAKKH